MKTAQSSKTNFEAISWGALLIWWGITVMIPTLPQGTGALGIGLILIGVNVARSLSGVPISSFSITVGILAMVWGVLELVGVLVNLPFEIPIFAILLIVLGIMVLYPALKSRQA